MKIPGGVWLASKRVSLSERRKKKEFVHLKIVRSANFIFKELKNVFCYLVDVSGNPGVPPDRVRGFLHCKSHLSPPRASITGLAATKSSKKSFSAIEWIDARSPPSCIAERGIKKKDLEVQLKSL